MKIRGVAKRGTLEFNGLRFSTTPAMYELTSDEAAVLQNLHGDRLTLEYLEPPQPGEEPVPGPTETDEPEQPPGRRRGVGVEMLADPPEDEPIELGLDQ